MEGNNEILVFIPFFKDGAQGRELEYSIAGWRRHFKENYRLVVVGDYHPVVDTGNDITFIECERVGEQPKENYRPHIDFVKKLKAFHEKFPDSKGFVFCADDVYAVNDFDMSDILVLKSNGDKIVGDHYSESAFMREKAKTIDRLQADGYPIKNFTTHLPQYYEWDKLIALWDRYDMENNSYIMEDLYYNIYYPDRIPFKLNIDHDNFKCGVYRPCPRWFYVLNAFKTKIWIQNSVEGWTPQLNNILENYYKLSK